MSPATRPAITETPTAGRTVGPNGRGWFPIDPDPPKRGPGTELFKKLDGELPLLLLPVRLETRYRPELKPPELRIRIYPDQIHVDADTPDPGPNEYRLTVAFWKEWFSSPDSVRRQAAWDRYVGQVGDRRAGYLARLLKPVRDDRNRLAYPKYEERERHRPAMARLLPKRWIAIGYLHGRRIFQESSNLIQPRLRVGPEAEAEVWQSSRSGLAIDDGLAWMVDYQRALQVGMAITVNLVDDAAAALDKVSQLLVVGIDRDHDEADLADLLDVHRRTGGMGFVRQGTPTNNLETEPSGWSNRPQTSADDMTRELLPTTKGDDNAGQFGRAMGFAEPDRFKRVANGMDQERVRSRAMVATLFEAVLGTYLRQLLDVQGQNGLTGGAINRGRRWCIDHVTGGAPLPTVRIGPQPYGVLPVMRSRAEPVGGAAEATEHVLAEVVTEWRVAASGLPTLDPNDTDVAGTEEHVHNIGRILATQPHPARLFTRKLLNYDDLNPFEKLLTPQSYYDLTLLGMDSSGNPNIGTPQLEMGLFYNIMVGSPYFGIETQSDTGWSVVDQIALWEELAEQVDDYLRQSGQYAEAEEAASQCANVIAVLGSYEQRQRPLRSLGLDRFEGRLGLDNTALVQGWFHADSDEWGEVGLVEMPEPPADGTAARYLADLKTRFQNRSGSTLGPSGLSQEFHDAEPLLYQLLEATLGSVPTGQRVSAQVARSLELLAAVPADELEWLTRETLGLGTNRIDAWHTALASQQLTVMRNKQPVGLNIGAYGWVTELEPRRERNLSEGFIHTPSMAHATTAAVLRAGWQSHGTNNSGSPAAVDLRSDRIRTALWLLDGIRQGQDLGDLLGYRFERELHDTNGDRFIRTIRAQVLEAGGESNTAPDQPVDGIALLDAWRDGSLGTVPGKVKRALQSLDDAFDATNDAGLFEAVHQLTLGNHERATAVLETMTTGTSSPPELRAQRSTRAGVGVEHRVVLLAEPDGPIAGGWSSGLRDRVAPAVERWVASIIPAAADVGFTATTDDGVIEPLTLADLPLSALDAVSLIGEDPDQPGPAFTTLVSAHQRGAAVTVQPSGTAPIDLAEFVVLAVELRRSLSQWRRADARDLRRPDNPGPAGLDFSAERTAVIDIDQDLDRLTDRLHDAITTGSDPTDLRATLALYGIADHSAAADHQGAERIHRQAVARLRVRSGVPLDPDGEDDLGPVLAKRMAALVGGPVPVLGSFTVSAVGDTDGEPMAFVGGLADEPAIDDWLDAVGRVRPEVSRLTTINTVAGLITDHAGFATVAGQYPYRPGEPWAATNRPTAETGGRTSVVIIGPVSRTSRPNPVPGQVLSGLFIDQWSERIPADEATTGLTFQFDAPSNRPPQTWLLVVPPDKPTDGKQPGEPVNAEPWSLRLVVDTLLETLEWAELRTVGAEDLGDYGRALPTVMAPGSISHLPEEEL